MSINLQELPSEINKLHHIIITIDAEKEAEKKLFEQKTNLLLEREKVLTLEILQLKET